MDWSEEMGACEIDAARAASGRLRVLVAADSRLVAEALMFSLETDPKLEAIGYALDGWEALDYMTTLKPDVVVAGPRLPALDSLRFSQFARELFPDMLLIALCDRLVPEEAESAYAAGVDDYLPLARSVDQLLRSISDARLRRHTFERGLRRPAYRPTLSLVAHGEVDARS
jgi:DNA-binding NarL/FixJ family response regulator